MASVPEHRTCGTHDVHVAMLRINADYARARAAIARRLQDLVRSPRATTRVAPRVIPVVVHVIYRNAEENISDDQVNSQIAVLNRDFRMKNPDVAGVPEPFKPLASDARVEFELARVDPEGQPTVGITRTHTVVPRFFSDNAMKFSAQGGKDAWDGTRYLNFWVCPEIIVHEAGDLAALGYAQFPGGLPATDGVAIIHRAFGNVGTAVAPFNLGRTATHEVGHWLDLFHIWGDQDGCKGDDQVDDTPLQEKGNRGRPTFPNITCNNGPNGDLFMNYMDYVDDTAMFMFTTGQVARMQATLSGPRSTIGSGAAAVLAGLGKPKSGFRRSKIHRD